jgi:hypothetical protein
MEKDDLTEKMYLLKRYTNEKRIMKNETLL